MGNLTPVRALRKGAWRRQGDPGGDARHSEGSGGDIRGDAARVQDDGWRAGLRPWPSKKGPAPGGGAGRR